MHKGRQNTVCGAEQSGTPETKTVRCAGNVVQHWRNAAHSRFTVVYPPGCPQKIEITRNGDRAGKFFALPGGVGKRAERGDSENVKASNRGDITLPRSFAHYVRSWDCGERCVRTKWEYSQHKCKRFAPFSRGFRGAVSPLNQSQCASDVYTGLMEWGAPMTE